MKMKHNGTRAALEARSTSSKLATNWEGEKEENENPGWSGGTGGSNKIENGSGKECVCVCGEGGVVNQIFYDNVLKFAVSKEEQTIRQN